jgi:hypothetical protein
MQIRFLRHIFLRLFEWDGVNCDNLNSSDTEITCLTNPWNFEQSAYQTDVEIYVEGSGFAFRDSDIYYSYVDLWSSKTTWGGNISNYYKGRKVDI